jgi:hypothetical protein
MTDTYKERATMAETIIAPTAGSVEDAIRAARNSALEAAAQVCDAEVWRLSGLKGTGYDTAATMARRIRKLKVDAAAGLPLPPSPESKP